MRLIAIADAYDMIYKWFDHLRSKGHYICGYVIMPNHVHALIAFRNTGQLINTIVGNGKRFLAYSIVDRLKRDGAEGLLAQLSSAVDKRGKMKHKIHEVWEPSFDWKECRTNTYMLQKLNYIHDNPCKGRWKLASAPADYIHSSAHYYISGVQGVYDMFHYCELADIDLTLPLR
ncbi:hypothetical protein LQ567_03825 [Niabella pedocola]|uniref:Transposase IS200-like domain-containing protein n=1 Tax=Niabella pedocola TaxID=1752077 RepID=A0ABS8PLJ6_9BACT|nr:transposase [Niabella pedocola]MCD2421876.1 hypothetical protein [Niabella pedocola]